MRSSAQTTLGQSALRRAQGVVAELCRLGASLGLPRPAAPPVDALLHSDLRVLLRQPGCPICRAEEDTLRRYLFWFVVETYGEAPGIEMTTAALGFCPVHRDRLVATRAAYQLSYLAQYLIEHYLPRLRSAQETAVALAQGKSAARRAWSRACARLSATAPCPACNVRDRQTDWLTRGLAGLLADPEIRERYRASDGLCAWHLRRALGYVELDRRAELVRSEGRRRHA